MSEPIPDPETIEADPADVAEQQAEVPVDDDRTDPEPSDPHYPA